MGGLFGCATPLVQKGQSLVCTSSNGWHGAAAMFIVLAIVVLAILLFRRRRS